MPVLSYPTGDFQPFTKILSTEVNGKFNAIKTLLNTTKLDSTNVQQYGLTRDRLAAGTASHVLINDASGYESSEAQLAISRGGTGLNIVPASQAPGDVIQVNAAGTGLTIGAPTSVPAALRIFNFYQFS